MKCLHYISRILLERSICCTLKRIVKYVVVGNERPEMAKETVTVRPDGHGWYISASLIEEFRRYDQGLSRSFHAFQTGTLFVTIFYWAVAVAFFY